LLRLFRVRVSEAQSSVELLFDAWQALSQGTLSGKARLTMRENRVGAMVMEP